MPTGGTGRDSFRGTSSDFDGDTITDFGDGKADKMWRNSDGALTYWASTGSGFDGGTGFYTVVDASWDVIGG